LVSVTKQHVNLVAEASCATELVCSCEVAWLVVYWLT